MKFKIKRIYRQAGLIARIECLFSFVVCILCLPLAATGGPLDPTADPSDPASATYTLNNIYTRLLTGVTESKRTNGFVGPVGAPTNATSYTLDQIMGALPQPAADPGDALLSSEVPSGLVFWGLKGGSEWGLLTGTSLAPAERMRAELMITNFSTTALSCEEGGSGTFLGGFLATGKTVEVFCSGVPATVTNIEDGRIDFEVPQGSGSGTASLTIDLVAMTGYLYQPSGDAVQLVGTTDFPYTYEPPQITGVTGGTTSFPPVTVGLSILGGETITIYGTNFGLVPEDITVDIAGSSCTEVQVPVPGQVTAVTPVMASGGWDLDLKVTVQGQSDTQPWVSYAGPELDPSSAINLTNCAGGEAMILTGSGFGTDPGSVTVRYGLPGSDFEDLPWSANVVTVSDNQIDCESGPGVGSSLVFQVKVGLQLTRESVTEVSYPVPAIIPATLSLSAAGPGSTNVVGAEELERVYFGVTNCGSEASFLQVAAGDPGGPYPIECGKVQLHNTNTVISCEVPRGTGSGKVFKVQALNQWTTEGTDTYNYPVRPTVTNVSGCVDVPPMTTGCSTKGGQMLTISGTGFTTNSPAVLVGSSFSDYVNVLSSSNIMFLAPAGAGTNRSVIVKCGAKISAPFTGLSYAPPSITRVAAGSSDYDVGNSVVNLPRAGGTALTIYGSNFGADSARVIIDGTICTATHDATNAHTVIYVNTPAKTVAPFFDRPLRVINGACIPSTNTFYITYRED